MMTEFLAWKASKSKYFGAFDTSIEKLQKPWPDDATYELIETNWFGFIIPEEGINSLIYPANHRVPPWLIFFFSLKESFSFSQLKDRAAG